MVRLKRNFTDTSQFDNGILPWGKALATSLQWLYDDDEFEDDSLSEAEYDRNILYYMDGVLPIYDFMSLVTDVIYMAFQDFGEPNIKNYINLLQDFETRKWDDKLHLQYDGEYMVLGKVSIFTTEVILWAAYLYCNIRKELDTNKERAIRAERLLYKLYARQTCLKPELVKDTFLMKHFNKTAVAFLKHIPTQGKDYNLKKCRADKGYRVSPELLVLRAIDSGDETKYEDLEEFEINTILDKLEGKGYIQVAWIEGHKPEAVRLLDKGRVYLKQLEEGSVVDKIKPSVTPQQPPKDKTSEIPSQTPNSPVREITWAERKQCFKSAVLHVMEKKKHDGEYLFEKPTQWKAVYRFAVDIGIMYDVEDPKEPKDKSTPQYAVFEKLAKELQLDVNPPCRMPFTKNAINDITKEYYIRYNTPYPWSYEGITDARSLQLFTKLDDVYQALQENTTSSSVK